MQSFKVIGRSFGPKGSEEGSYDNNHMLNLLHDVEFPDVQVKECSANVIEEIMMLRVDSDGFLETMLEAITYYAKDDAVVDIADEHVIAHKGRRRLRKTTKILTNQDCVDQFLRFMTFIKGFE